MMIKCSICRIPSTQDEVRNTFDITLKLCPICHDKNIENPQILKCGHGHCQNCTTKLFTRQNCTTSLFTRQIDDEWTYDIELIPEPTIADWDSQVVYYNPLMTDQSSSYNSYESRHPNATGCWDIVGNHISIIICLIFTTLVYFCVI
jgi:hypothetical protein